MTIEELRAELARKEYTDKTDAERLAMLNDATLTRAAERAEVAADTPAELCPGGDFYNAILEAIEKHGGALVRDAVERAVAENNHVNYSRAAELWGDGTEITQADLNRVAQADLAYKLEALRNEIDGILSQRRAGVACDVMSVLKAYSE